MSDINNTEDALKKSEARYRRIYESNMLGIVFWDLAGNIFEANDAFLSIAGYTRQELLAGKVQWNRIKPLEYALLDERGFEELTTKGVCGPFEKEYTREDGSRIPILLGIALLEGYKDRGFCFLLDITKRKRLEKLQSAVYRIGGAVHTSPTLNSLFGTVHEIIKSVMPASNFYIALFDEKHSLLNFPYFVDEVDSYVPSEPVGKGLTAYVLRTGKSLLCDDKVSQILEQRGEVELVGVPSAIWLGVPLIVDRKTIGVMVVQDYSNPEAYGYQEKQMLEFVSNEVALAIERKRSEGQIRIFAHAFESTSELISITDINNRFTFVNESFLKTYGYSQEEILGKTPDTLGSNLNPTNIHQQILEETEKHEGWSTELINRKKNGTEFPVSLSTSTIKDPDGKVIGYIGVAENISERKAAEQQLKQSSEQVHNLASRLQLAREEESIRIAREIHDELGQKLTGIKIDLSFFEEMISKNGVKLSDDALKTKIKSMNSLIDSAIQSVRKTAAELRPTVLDTLGLLDAIDWQAKEFKDRTGVDCKCLLDDELSHIGSSCSTALFRIVQESLTNIARHANASTVTISLKTMNDNLFLEIEDNGKGILESEAKKTNSFGVLGMRERVIPFDGSFEIKGTGKKGTVVQVIIPMLNTK